MKAGKDKTVILKVNRHSPVSSVEFSSDVIEPFKKFDLKIIIHFYFEPEIKIYFISRAIIFFLPLQKTLPFTFGMLACIIKRL